MPKKDYYEILGLNKESSVDDIKKAYRSLAKKYHPDKNPNSKSSEEKFKDIQEAYDTLSDSQKRANYDQIREAEEKGYFFSGSNDIYTGFGTGRDRYSDSRFDDFGGIGDLFSRIFDKGERTRTNKQRPKRGTDITYELDIPFEKAISGWDTVISISKVEECPSCRGTGAKSGTTLQKCPECNGQGTINLSQRNFPLEQTCPRCQGKGSIIAVPCQTCSGMGYVQQMRRIPVTIPPGTEDKTKIRVPGQGGIGVSGGPKGDLYIIAKVKEHRFFKRKNYDIICKVTIDFIQAIMGVNIMVSTINGKVKLTIPPGTQPGTSLRLKGQGIIKPDGSKGDQLVTVDISLPTNITEKQKELLRQFQEE
jgi:molecular chaperone DnaJ